MSCKFCNFDKPEIDWEIGLYRNDTDKKDEKIYTLELAYPADGEPRRRIKPVVVNYCPVCGKPLKLLRVF